MKMYKILSLIACAVTLSISANAQSNDADVKERFSTQLRNGSVPGLKFAPVTTMLQTKQEDNHTEPENTARDTRNGKAKNLKTAQSAATDAAASQPARQPVLMSDNKPELKKEEKKGVKHIIPSQENTN